MVTNSAILAIRIWDGDQVDNAGDNCPRTDNGDQVDFDNDGAGDACDTDDDDDGVVDGNDQCQGTPYGVVIDLTSVQTSGCSGPQLFELICSTDSEYINHGKYVSCVSQEAERQVDIGMITEEEKGANRLHRGQEHGR